jgi:hypothetical protein
MFRLAIYVAFGMTALGLIGLVAANDGLWPSTAMQGNR